MAVLGVRPPLKGKAPGAIIGYVGISVSLVKRAYSERAHLIAKVVGTIPEFKAGSERAQNGLRYGNLVLN